jgi:hypothetical protein
MPTPPKLNLDAAIQQALVDPSAANMHELLNELDRSLGNASQELQLQIAGTVLAQLADVLAARADQLLEAWEEKHNPITSEPILTSEMLQDVLRQTMSLNLEDVIQLASYRYQGAQPSETLVGAVDKANLLAFLAHVDQRQPRQDALAMAHDENVAAWVETIAHWQQKHPHQEISLLELQRSLQMPLIQIWLALLLGGFTLEQRGEFYQLDGIWVA